MGRQCFSACDNDAPAFQYQTIFTDQKIEVDSNDKTYQDHTPFDYLFLLPQYEPFITQAYEVATNSPYYKNKVSKGEDISSIDGMKKTTEDEAMLIRIADQAVGTKWEDAVLYSRSAEDIVHSFAKLGINANENDIRLLTSKYGLVGFVDAIKARM